MQFIHRLKLAWLVTADVDFIYNIAIYTPSGLSIHRKQPILANNANVLIIRRLELAWLATDELDYRCKHAIYTPREVSIHRKQPF